LTLGGRYSSDKLNFNVTERGVSYASTNGVATVIGRQKNKPFVPKASLAFQATPTALYYATYSEGYRTGGVNKTLPSTCTAEAARLGISPQTYDPDRTKNYEIGTKNRIMGGAIQYEASGFYIKWNNIQQQLRLDCAFSLVTNSGSATSKGFDLNLTIRPSRTLTIGFAAGYVNATYDRTIQFSTAPVLVAGQTLGANVTPWTINLNGEYHLPVERYDPYVRVQYNLKTANKGLYLYQVPTSTTYDPTRRYLDDIESLDVRAGMQFGNFNVALYTENLLNNHAFTSYNPAFAGSSLVKATTNRPRTIGLQMFARY
jgi:outer membrane receptor protein involved in Fe transport